MAKIDWQKFQDFSLEHKGMLCVFASPETDEIFISFNKRNAFVRFPFESKEKGVVFNALRQSKFKETIDPLMNGIIEATGITETNKDGNELLKVIGGGVKSLGVGGDRLKENKNAKKSKKS